MERLKTCLIIFASRTCTKAARQVLQYTLFQPGLFLDYLAFPHKTAKHLTPLNTFIDFQNRRAIVVDDRDAVMTLTTIQDLAAIVARAVDLGGEWPVTGGVSGNRVAVSQVLQIGEKVRGKCRATHSSQLAYQHHDHRQCVYRRQSQT